MKVFFFFVQVFHEGELRNLTIFAYTPIMKKTCYFYKILSCMIVEPLHNVCNFKTAFTSNRYT